MNRANLGAWRRVNLMAAAAALLLAAAALSLPESPALAQTRVFDSHVHLWSGETSLREYEADIAALDAEVAGFATMWFGGPNQVPQGRLEATAAGNDAILALGEQCAARGARVLKIHAHTQRFDVADPRVLALVRRAGELDVIVLMDNANILPGDSEKLFNLALAAPDTNFIFAHIGGMNFRFWNILHLARTAEDLFANNIYFDISGASHLAADSPIEAEFIWTLRNVGIDHLLLGSDYPQLPLSAALDALERLDLTEDEKAQIRYGNAARLFGL